MRIPWLTLSALFVGAPAIALAAKASTHDTLVQLAAQGNGIIKLDSQSFDLLTAPHRDWTSSVQFTALDKKRRCAPCKEFEPSWAAVAKAWTTVPKPQRDQHFFAVVDFDSNPAIFQKLGLQSAPVVFNYGATEGPRKSPNANVPVTYEFSNGFDAQPLADQLSLQTPVPIPYRAPINWGFWAMSTLAALALALAVRFLGPVFRSRWTWAAVTVFTSLVMTSGYMFTKIRGTPMTAADGQWIAPGFQNQYGQETTVVASMYGLLSASFLMLALVAPLQTSRSRQKIQIYLWTGVIFIMFSVLISLFRVKNRGNDYKSFLSWPILTFYTGYPFKLLL
ncbi:oligosaccharyl transferase subunit OST3/OST6 family [Amylostereum chailletii]|nr:oligosaccharyl transferase subunit OST3/OST6 family [Amylostereum chailletii]